MTQTTEEKALALVKQFYPECRDDYQGRRLQIAIAAIEQHEAFRQEVSDAVSKAIRFCKDGRPASAAGAIGAFIIPAPKPDPLVEIFDECFNKDVFADETWSEAMARKTRAAMDKLGFEIREKSDDN